MVSAKQRLACKDPTLRVLPQSPTCIACSDFLSSLSQEASLSGLKHRLLSPPTVALVQCPSRSSQLLPKFSSERSAFLFKVLSPPRAREEGTDCFLLNAEPEKVRRREHAECGSHACDFLNPQECVSSLPPLPMPRHTSRNNKQQEQLQRATSFLPLTGRG